MGATEWVVLPSILAAPHSTTMGFATLPEPLLDCGPQLFKVSSQILLEGVMKQWKEIGLKESFTSFGSTSPVPQAVAGMCWGGKGGGRGSSTEDLPLLSLLDLPLGCHSFHGFTDCLLVS